MITVDDALAKVAQAESSSELSASAAAAIRRWLTETPFTHYWPRLLQDIDEGRWKVLDDAFFAVLEFGTGGRRGVMYPVGTNVLNERTIAESARGLADYVTAHKGRDEPRSCVIARDSRHNSPEFGELCAGCWPPPDSRYSCSRKPAPPPCSPLPSGTFGATPGS